MKFMLTCTVVLLLASNVELLRKGRRRKIDVVGAFTDANITADTNVTAPKGFLQVILFENTTVNLGNDIFYGDTRVLTSIGFYVTPGYFNTLMFVDLDFPNRNDSSQSPLLLNLVVNIVSLDLEAADVVTKYVAPNPPPETGAHRIVYYLFSQEYEIDATSISYLQSSRRSFPLEDFIADNGLHLEAGNFFRVQFPDLQELCEEYNCNTSEEDCNAI